MRRDVSYKCIICGKYEGQKTRVIAHIYKYHIPLDSVRFYCSLCDFRTEQKDKLLKHVKCYSRHEDIRNNLIKRAIEPKPDNAYLKRNKQFTLVVEGKHFEKIDKANVQTLLFETQDSQQSITKSEDFKGQFPKILIPKNQVSVLEQRAPTQFFNSDILELEDPDAESFV